VILIVGGVGGEARMDLERYGQAWIERQRWSEGGRVRMQ
jgi:hypothetical protein